MKLAQYLGKLSQKNSFSIKITRNACDNENQLLCLDMFRMSTLIRGHFVVN